MCLIKEMLQQFEPVSDDDAIISRCEMYHKLPRSVVKLVGERVATHGLHRVADAITVKQDKTVNSVGEAVL